MTPEPENDSFNPRGALAAFFGAPFRLRTYGNLLYLALAFPLGLAYFVFLTVGLTLGYGLTVVWIGIPILALVFAASWALTAFERRLAIGLLGAEVPPMAPPPDGEARTFLQRVRAFLANPVTWKGMGYLLLKLPLGVATFIAWLSLLAVSGSLLAAPILWQFGDLEADVDLVVWQPTTWADTWVCAAMGLVLLLVSLNLLNGLAALWRWTATLMLGSRRFETAPRPSLPSPAAA